MLINVHTFTFSYMTSENEYVQAAVGKYTLRFTRVQLESVMTFHMVEVSNVNSH